MSKTIKDKPNALRFLEEQYSKYEKRIRKDKKKLKDSRAIRNKKYYGVLVKSADLVL